MKERGLTQEEFALARGIARPTISQKLSGVLNWTSDDYRFMAGFFNKSADYLMGLSDAEEEVEEPAPFAFA